MGFRGYRRIINAHALNRVLKPVYKPRPKLAVFPYEHLHSIEQPFRFVPAHRFNIVHEDYRENINKVYEQKPETPEVEKPAKSHWFGYPV
jgi:predicted nucleotidyltransferase